jgi:hypothetical protein
MRAWVVSQDASGGWTADALGATVLPMTRKYGIEIAKEVFGAI